MKTHNTTIKLVNKSLINVVGNLFTGGKNIGAIPIGLECISHGIDVQAIVNMTVDILKLTNRKFYSNAKAALAN